MNSRRKPGARFIDAADVQDGCFGALAIAEALRAPILACLAGWAGR